MGKGSVNCTVNQTIDRIPHTTELRADGDYEAGTVFERARGGDAVVDLIAQAFITLISCPVSISFVNVCCARVIGIENVTAGTEIEFDLEKSSFPSTGGIFGRSGNESPQM